VSGLTNQNPDKIIQKSIDLSVNVVPSDYSAGRNGFVVLLWFIVQTTLFNLMPRPFYAWRRFWLIVFGAKIASNVRIRPNVIVEFPWRLEIGENSSIGDHAWIYTVAPITIGKNCVISQYAKLVTGSHDVTSSKFVLKTAPIVIEDNSWVGANAFVGPGVTVSEGSVLAACTTAFKNLEPWKIYGGTGATFIKDRILKQ
jgi:putative colanic acid biosynthesis acetyltransferase WcaF